MYYFMEIFNQVDVIVTPTTGYVCMHLSLVRSNNRNFGRLCLYIILGRGGTEKLVLFKETRVCKIQPHLIFEGFVVAAGIIDVEK